MTDRTRCLVAAGGDPTAGVTRRLAVVVGGGGKRGAFEVGLINALASREVVPELLVGTSVGAINAAFWAFHPDATAGLRLLELWKDAERFVQISGTWLTGLRLVMSRQNHLVRPHGLLTLLQQAFGPSTRIEDSHIPLVIAAVDLMDGSVVRLCSGPLIDTLMASCAIPGLYPPVRVDGRLLIDGGVLANCDLQAACDAGASDVIAVDLSADSGRQSPQLCAMSCIAPQA